MRAIVSRYEEGVLGLPADGKFIPVTNSGMGGMKCLRRWHFSNVEGLRRPVGVTAIDRGAGWDTIIEDIYRWWMVQDQPYPNGHLVRCGWCRGTGEGPAVDPGIGNPVLPPCPRCEGTGDGALERAMRPWMAALERDDADFGVDEVEHERERLLRAFTGYVARYEARPLQHFRIVGVQTRLARAVVNPATGSPYRPSTYLTQTPDGWVYATPEDVAEGRAKLVNWPVYLLGELDAAAADRSTGAGWVIDAKYSADPWRYESALGVDPQLPQYCWLLDAHREKFGMTSVTGFLYDVVNSKFHQDPQPLKWKPPKLTDLKDIAASRGIEVEGRKVDDYLAALDIQPGHGGFSLRKVATVPSWRYRWALEREELDEEPYEEHLEYLETEVDRGFYLRCWDTYSAEDYDRSAAEVLGKARQVAALRRMAMRAGTPRQLATAFPRTPICTMAGGSCPFRAPCVNDTPEAREGYERRPVVVWSEDEAPDPRQEELLGYNHGGFNEEVGF